MYNGMVILALLVLLNASVLPIPPLWFRNPRPLSMIKATSVCLIGACIALMLIEALFPVVMPKEYAQVKELSKGFMASSKEAIPDDCLVYDNSDQLLRPVAVRAASHSSQYKAWHVPGKRFAYFGYDPNSGQKYVNRFRWNALGYFDDDHDLAKAEGVRRVVIVGDSFVEAIQVPLDKTFHKLLEQMLNRSSDSASAPRFEVIALGNSGAGQVENLRTFRSVGLSYNPDLVIVSLCSNDFCDDDPELSADRLLAQGDVSRVFRGLVVHGYNAMAFAYRRINDLRRNRIEISPELLQWSAGDYPAVEAAWRRTLSAISDQSNLCKKKGIPFAVLYLGSDLEVRYILDPEETLARLKAMGGPHRTVQWDLGKSLRRVQTYCDEKGIPMISLLEPLASAQAESGKFVFGDHYTVFGHQVVAGVLSCALRTGMPAHVAGNQSFDRCVSSRHWDTEASVLGLKTTH